MLLLQQVAHLYAQERNTVNLVPVDSGWAANSVNTVVFRKNSLVTYKQWQYIAYYDANKMVVLGKRKHGSDQWQLRRTTFTGNTNDAHNTISIMVDGAGYLHLAWDHHNNPLNYAISIKPGSLEMTGKITMTGSFEKSVSYPEFYKMASGDLLFLYRDGGSGRGNLVVNYYHTKNKQWHQLQSNLIDGEGKRNAYWQACTDNKGSIHISWVWRESPDVASNHDMCYARSDDGGKTWVKSTGDQYQLPITLATAEYALRIPQNSELINQTSMYADANGIPYIATYWRNQNETIPQYQVIFKDAGEWKKVDPGFRKTAFSLSGAGTKSIPISRPQIITWPNGNKTGAMLIFRDQERDAKVSVAITQNMIDNHWELSDLTRFGVGSWEATYDTEWWKKKNKLNLFIQNVVQVDAEGTAAIAPQLIQVLEWKPVY